MKKVLLLTLVSIMVFASMSSAAMKLGVVGSFGTDAWFVHPGLVITPNNMKNVDYDILVGYSSVGVGEDIDANVGLLLGGTWWVGQAGPITYGPTVVYYSQGITDATGTVDKHGKVVSDKASDNTITSLNFVFSAKAPLVAGIDARADVVVYSSVSGKHYGEDIKDSNQMLSTIQLSLQYTFPM